VCGAVKEVLDDQKEQPPVEDDVEDHLRVARRLSHGGRYAG
jgi:hypothetical protein